MKNAGLLVAFLFLTMVSSAMAADLTFTEGNNFTENGSFMVMGFVKNTSNHALKDITIIVKYYDKAGKFIRFETASANPPVLKPGEEASYRVVIPEDKGIASIKKTAKWAFMEDN